MDVGNYDPKDGGDTRPWMVEGRTMHDSMDGGGRVKHDARTEEQLSRVALGQTHGWVKVE